MTGSAMGTARSGLGEEILVIGTLIVCAHLAVVDGDTLKCDGQLLRLLGEGEPFVSGIDAPELRTWKCQKERKLATWSIDAAHS